MSKLYTIFFNKNLGMSQRYTGFSLAEVLVTLTIIGVVAAMTIPILSKSYQDSQYKTAYKKAYSDLSNALNAANSEYSLDYAPQSYAVEHWTNFKTIMSHLKLQKTCWNYVNPGEYGYVLGGNSECWNPNGEKWHPSSHGGYPDNSDMAIVTLSGMSWALCARGAGDLYAVDTNGSSPPNQMGKDRFVFQIVGIENTTTKGIPTKVKPYTDNASLICTLPNKCATEMNYYSTKWLYD